MQTETDEIDTQIPTTMHASDSIKQYIKGKEASGGKPNLIAYVPLEGTANGYAIGYGHTDKSITPGMTITQDQAEQYFDDDITGFENIANKIIKVDVTQNCYDAIIDMLFDGIPISSMVYETINQSDFEGASAWIKDHYIMAGGVKEPGLVSRREYDSQLIAA